MNHPFFRLFRKPVRNVRHRSDRLTIPFAIERLDDRICPTVTASVIDGHILRVVGNELANQIALADEGAGRILLSVPEQSLNRAFTGIDTVVVRSGAGNDTVSVARLHTGENPGAAPANLYVDLGSGDDTFLLTEPGGSSAQQSATVWINAGDGSDTVRLDYTGDPRVSRPFEPNDNIEVHLGRGNDLFSLQLPVSNADIYGGGGGSGIIAEIYGGGGGSGDGIDTFRTTATGVLSEVPNMRSSVGVGFNIHYVGGDGNDIFDTAFLGVNLNAPASLTMDGGAGDDRFVTLFQGVGINAPVELNQSGGQGNDDIRVISGFNPQPDPPAVQLTASLSIQADGGDGNDTIAVQINHPDFEGVAQLNVHVDGGRGNDILNVESVDPVGELYGTDHAQFNVMVRGGAGQDVINVHVGMVDEHADWELELSTRISIDGGEGDDLITARLTPFINAGNSFSLAIDGGAGNDVLTSTIIPCIRDGGSLTVTMDGGSGDDLVVAAIYVDPMSDVNHSIRCVVRGGEGNDTLALVAVDPVGNGGQDDFFLDGGSGIDTLLASTSNVRVRNIER